MSLIDEVRTVRERIAERLRELEPLVQEYNELRRIAAEMGLEEIDPEAGSSPPRNARRGPAARSGRRGVKTKPNVRGRNEAGELAERVLEAVRAQPGKAVADYAAILDVAPTALYRPVRELTIEGALTKRSRQLYPA
jgi:hypothetical protein